MKKSKKLTAVEKIRREKRRRYIKITLISIIVIAVIAIGVSFKLQYSNNSVSNENRRYKAIIIDGLYDSYPNDKLIYYIKDALERKGFAVDMLLGKNVTVDNLQFKLFSLIDDYRIIILRVHGGVIKSQNNYVGRVGIFTSEPYDPNKHTDLLYMGFLGMGIPFAEPGKKYFVITPLYVLSSNTRFQGSIIYVSSCYSLSAPDMAEAFIKKGAKAYIGWNNKIDINTADQALKLFVKEFIEENKTLCQVIYDINYKLSANNYLLEMYPEQYCNITIEEFKDKVWSYPKS